MRTKLFRYLLSQFLTFWLIFTVLPVLTIAQSEEKKEVENNKPTSLQGLTEAVLVDGQPTLRILSKYSGSTEINLQQRDNEDTLVFSVARVIRYGFGYKPGDEGKLSVTKTRVIYSPNFDKKQFFNVLSSDIQDLKIDVAGLSGISSVNFEVKNDKKRFIFSGVLMNNKDWRPAFEFLFRAIENYDSALAEFNQLTASLRSETEIDEVVEEATEAEINDKYDRFQNITLVSTSKMLVRGKKRSIRTNAEYNFEGKTQKKPKEILLYFYASANSPLFREDNLKLNFLVNNERIPLGEMKLADEEKTKTATKQTIAVKIPYDIFKQIANGKTVEFQIGTLEYKLTDIHLEAFKKLLTYQIEE